MVSHLDVAHFLLQRHVRLGDTVIDATCGNGNDAALLADLALSLNGGILHCLDIQKAAIESTKQRLEHHPHRNKIFFHTQSHEVLPHCTPSTVIYNLGYLPGGDKSLTTSVDSTFRSLESALTLLKPGGALFVTFYPGHSEGARELHYAHEWMNAVMDRKLKIFIYKQLSSDIAPQLYVLKKPFPKKVETTI